MTEENKLFLIPSNNDLVNSENHRYKLIRSDGWYLHGKLEGIVGIDLCYLISSPDIKKYLKRVPKIVGCYTSNGKVISITDGKFFKEFPYINGVVECEIVGVIEECIGYFWTIQEKPMEVYTKEGDKPFYSGIFWKQKGLICLKSDKEGIEHAEDKFRKRAEFL